MLQEYVLTDTDSTYFLGSIFCESLVDENSCHDNSQGCDSVQFCYIDSDVSDKTERYIDPDVNSDFISFKIDSGADVIAILIMYCKTPHRPCLESSNVVLNISRGQLSLWPRLHTKIKNVIILFKSVGSGAMRVDWLYSRLRNGK